MEVSIIMPALNEAGSITQTLSGLQDLRRSGVELVLVDGGSSDGTTEVARQWVDQLVDSEAGRAHQMNCGASTAKGDVLWFLHADTHLPADALTEVRKAIETEHRGWGRFDVRLDGRHPLLRLVAFLMNGRSCLTAVATGDQAIFIRRDWFEAVGGYPEIALMEDVAISKRLRSRGRPWCSRRKVVTSARRWESKGVVRTIVLMWFLRLAYVLGVSPDTLAGWYRR